MVPDELAAADDVLLHYGEDEHLHGAVVPPIFQNSLFVFPNVEAYRRSYAHGDPYEKGFLYSRVHNPTLEIVERKLAKLEGTDCAKVFGSGMAAISAAIFSAVEAGSHVVCVDTVYGPTRQLLQDYLPKFGVTTSLVDGCEDGEVFDAIRPETTLIFLESPSSMLFRLQDLEAIARVAREKRITTAIDNSYASPLFQNPARLGIDIVTHSATKYLAGHSDLVAGALCTSKARMERIIERELALFGGILAPLPAWLLLRGMRTLGVRMRAHAATADAVANWLADHPAVSKVHHIGRPDHPQRALIDRQMSGYGGLLSFELHDPDPCAVDAVINRLHVFQIGVSWGGFESLVVPASVQCRKSGKTRTVARLFCGLERAETLIADLDQALATG